MIERARAEVQRLIDRIDEFSLRERALVFLGVLAFMYIAAVQLVIDPLSVQRQRLDQQLKAKREQIQSMEQQIQNMVGGTAADADAQKRTRIATLKEELRALDTELGKATSGLVPPKEMAHLVEQFLAGRRGLEVVKVESLAPEPLMAESLKATAVNVANPPGRGPAAGAFIYKHGMRIELRGNYLEMLSYLQAMEALPWKVFWGQVSLKAEKYPVSRLTLVIYTLNTREGWIGT